MGITITKDLTKLAERLRRMPNEVKLDAGDKLYVGERQRARILERTGRGVDVDGQAFRPYSKRRFYWSPNSRMRAHLNKRVGNLRAGESIRVHEEIERRTKRSVKRYFRIFTKGEKFKKGAAPYVTASGMSICFPGGYDQFKRSLGRSAVDLRGVSAPHMLQAIQVRPTGDGVKLGIFGEKGALAAKHNTGKGAPKREFFGVSRKDERDAAADALGRVRAKLKGVKL